MYVCIYTYICMHREGEGETNMASFLKEPLAPRYGEVLPSLCRSAMEPFTARTLVAFLQRIHLSIVKAIVASFLARNPWPHAMDKSCPQFPKASWPHSLKENWSHLSKENTFQLSKQSWFPSSKKSWPHAMGKSCPHFSEASWLHSLNERWSHFPNESMFQLSKQSWSPSSQRTLGLMPWTNLALTFQRHHETIP